MSDLISRADAISVLEIFTQTDVLGHTPKQIVEALPSAQPEPKWIPCRERLPKNHENVLVCGVEALNNVHIYGVKCWDVDEWMPVSAPSCTWEAWMPLPEPYAERRTDEADYRKE